MAGQYRSITRDQLAKFLPDPESIKRFESLFQAAEQAGPSATEEALNSSLTANAAAASAQAAVDSLAEVVQRLELAPPPPELGSMSLLQQDNVPWLTFNTAPANIPTAVGSVYWDGGTTLNMQATTNVIIRIGQAQFVYVKASAAITKGQLTYHTGAVGASGVITVAPTPLALADPNQIIGVAAETIAHNGFGLIQITGLLRGFATNGTSVGEVWADGDPLYYNPAYVGSMTKNKPSAPNQKTYIGEVVNAAAAGSGSMQIRVLPGSVLGGTDSNVQFAAVADKDLIQYDNALGYWKNVTAAGLTVGTATNLAGGAVGSVPYQSGAGATTFLPIGTAVQVLKVNAGATAPQWVSGAALTKVDDTNVTLTLGGTAATSLLAATSLTLGWTGTLSVARGGTAQSAWTANGLVYASGTTTLTNSSALTFDGTNLATTGTASATKLIPTGGSAADNGMYLPAANTLAWSNGGTETMRLDSAGNLGIGVTPSAWVSYHRGIDFGGGTNYGGLSARGDYVTLANNCYLDSSGSTWRYKNTSTATQFAQTGGGFVWYIAASGTAGNAITFTTSMVLDSAGNLTVPAMYGTTVTTPRNVFIDSAGKMGGISSTRASKINIAPLTDVSWLYKLEPVSFNYRKRTENGAYLDAFESETQLGMIAEQVAPHAPELCIYDADGKVAGIHYDRMIAPLLKALQDQAVRIASLEKTILSITSTATDTAK